MAKQRNTANDIAILQFDLNARVPAGGDVQRSRASPPAQARGRSTGQRVVGANERGHVKAIQGAVGAGHCQEPKVQLSRSDRGRPCLHGDCGRLRGSDRGAAEDPGDPGGLASGAGSAEVAALTGEPHHAAWIRHIAGIVPAEQGLRPADIEGQRGQAGQRDASSPLRPKTKGRRKAQVHGVSLMPSMHHSGFGAALGLAGLLIGAAVAVVLVGGACGPLLSSRLFPSPLLPSRRRTFRWGPSPWPRGLPWSSRQQYSGARPAQSRRRTADANPRGHDEHRAHAWWGRASGPAGCGCTSARPVNARTYAAGSRAWRSAGTPTSGPGSWSIAPDSSPLCCETNVRCSGLGW